MDKNIKLAIKSLMTNKIGSFNQRIKTVLNRKIIDKIHGMKGNIFKETFNRADPGTEKFMRMVGYSPVGDSGQDYGTVKDLSASAGRSGEDTEVIDPDSVVNRLNYVSIDGTGI